MEIDINMNKITFEGLKGMLKPNSPLYVEIIAPSGVDRGKLFAQIYMEDNLRCEKDKLFVSFKIRHSSKRVSSPSPITPI